MPCYHPLTAYQTADGDVIFNERKGDSIRQLQLACGQCIGCRLERSRQWAIRCMHEAQLWDENCFITLTYNDEHLPNNGGLNYRHFQLFMKRLRKQTKRKDIRFYMGGEYGEQGGRPHYHACLFNYRPNDLEYYKKGADNTKLYTSKALEKIWGMGQVTIGELTFESAAYTARYIMKKVTGKQAARAYEVIDLTTGELTQLKPEFNNMSRKPGIGKRWIEKFQTDVYPQGQVIVRGHESKAPRYYDKHFEKTSPIEYDLMQFERHKEATKRAHDNTPERQRIKETVAKAKASQLKRNL